MAPKEMKARLSTEGYVNRKGSASGAIFSATLDLNASDGDPSAYTVLI